MSILEKLLLFFKGARLISTDYYGNQYYVLKEKDVFKRPARYVKYYKKQNASNIPPLWASWLRHTVSDEALKIETEKIKAPFVMYHQPNLTGTNAAYSQSQIPANNKKTQTKIYQAWSE